MKKVLSLVLALIAALSLSACGSGSVSSGSASSAGGSASSQPQTIQLGSGGTYADMIDVLAELVADKGYGVEMVLFDSNSGPADACSGGDIDGFIYNHAPWLEQYNLNNNTDLTEVSPLYYGRTALYSAKYTSLDELPDGATIAIPNDSTNMDNTLLFLQKLKLIELGEKTDSFYTTLDVVSNPKNIEFVETEISYTARSIEDCDAVVCAAQYILDTNLDPNVFLAENTDKQGYPIGLTVRAGDADSEWVKALDEALHSDEFRTRFDELYKGTLVLY